ncbi:hypothetical protein [Thalassotalea fusca]
MRKLLTAPAKMNLTEQENSIYQNALKFITDISLNLMAVKVENHPQDFLGWCQELLGICQYGVNQDLLDEAQFKPFNKLQDVLRQAISTLQLRMLRITPWPLFSQFIQQNDERQSLTERIALLNYVSTLKASSFADMIEEDRLTILGKHTAKHEPSLFPFDVEWFASTRHARNFHQVMTTEAQIIDALWQHIPDEGEVTFAHYQAFIESFLNFCQQHLPEEKASLTIASRLLAMKRPDTFVALSNAKFDAISLGFGIPKLNNSSFQDYWFELIATMREMPWYNSEQPEDESEVTLWQYRAILIDCFFNAAPSQAENSNYIKLRDKPKNTTVKMPRATKRTKASAKELVDRALTEGDHPEFLHKMRGTLIKSVQDGKTVEQAINLMKSIFG